MGTRIGLRLKLLLHAVYGMRAADTEHAIEQAPSKFPWAAAQVFDDKATFAEWFGDALGKNALAGGADEWRQTEKRVVVIHRLHQILEPFMLRRQVQDVEASRLLCSASQRRIESTGSPQSRACCLLSPATCQKHSSHGEGWAG